MSRGPEPPLLRGRRTGLLALLVANGLAQAAAAVATALLVERAFDRLVIGASEADLRTAWPLGAGLLAAVVVSGWLRMRERQDAERLGQDYVHDVRDALFERILAFAPRALERRSRGALSMRFVGDVSAIRQWVSLGLSRMVVGGCFVGGAITALAFVNLRLSAALAAVLGVGALGALALGRPMRDAAREARRRRGRLAGLVTERVGAVAVVHAFGQDEREQRRVAKRSRHLREAMIARARVIGGMRGLTEAVVGLTTVVVLLVGAVEVAGGRASPGTVVAAMAVVGLLASPLRDLGRVSEYWYGSRVALERARDLPPGSGRLALEGIGVDGALHDVTARLEPGRAVAVIGPNGAGKSTLVAVAARLLDPDRGRVLIDGHDLAEVTLASARRAVGIAGPDLPLLRGTVDYNVRYRSKRASAEELERVRELCALDELAAALPRGMETKVAEDGRGLSAGQRQRIALARALLGRPAVLLLDEADANLDEQARAVVDRVVDDQRLRGSVLVVTHRRELVERCDEVWALEGGRLAEMARSAEGALGRPPSS
jgi:ABC-type multidrug transport system fused ATPase/permease subunit